MTTYTYTTLDYPLAQNITEATGINAAGQIVGYYYSSGTANGFLYSGGKYTTLDDPLASIDNPNTHGGTLALGINDKVRSSGLITTAAVHPTASYTAAALTLRSTIPWADSALT